MAEHNVKARIALVMAVRDQANGLHHALNSLLCQSHANLTITLVDDGSQDHTPEVLEKFAHDQRLQVISTRPQGLIPSLNLAMQKTRPAAFYGVVYASCFYSFNYIGAMLQTLQRAPQAAGAFCCFSEGHATHVGTIFQEPAYDNNELLVRNGLGPGVLFRGEAFRQAGGIFLSERKGIWETWQRMSAYGHFEKLPHILVRWSPHPYDNAPPSPKLDPEKDLYPHLNLRIQLLPGDTVDGGWISLLQQAGHSLGSAEQLKGRPQLVVCGSVAMLGEAMKQAFAHYAPLMLVLNDAEAAEGLVAEPRLKFVLANCTIATRTLKLAQMLKQHKQQAIVYMHGMTKRETNRLLTRVPMVLYRHRSVVLVRAYGHPHGLSKTLHAIQHMNRPPEFGDLLIYCVDPHPELVRWLKASPYAWQMASRGDYFSELLFLLRQLKASYVFGIDAGVIPAADYFTSLWPLLADPIAGMVAGHLNEGPGAQALPLPAADPGELMKLWPSYRPQRQVDAVDRLSDSAFLIRKQVFEWALESFPDTMPLADDALFSRLLAKAGFLNLLNRKTVAFNMTYTI